MNKLSVGQKIWFVSEYKYHKFKNEPKEVTISYIRGKYFKVQENSRNRFEIETMMEEGKSNYNGKCFITLDEILEGKESINLKVKLKNYFSSYKDLDLTLEQLREIDKIITKDCPLFCNKD